MISSRLSRPWFRRAFIGATTVWALLLPLAAFAASRSPDWRLTHASAVLPYAIGAVVCHQQAARSFELWSRQMPVCARCTGIYVGAAVLALVASTFRRASALRHNEPVTPSLKVAQGFSPARTIILAGLPSLATLVYEWSTGAMPSHTIRALAGFPLGAAVALIILTAVDDQVN